MVWYPYKALLALAVTALPLAATTSSTVVTATRPQQLRNLHVNNNRQASRSVDDIITGDSTLSTLSAAFEAADLVGALCQDCNFVLFAPVNAAFAEIDGEFLTKLLTPPWILHLKDLLSFHATTPTEGRVLSTDLTDGTELTMLNHETIGIDIDGDGSIFVVSEFSPETEVIQADLLANNGVVHKVDSVLLPDFVGTDLAGLASSPAGRRFSILFQLLNLTGLVLDDNTVFAPTNAAFAALGQETLNSLLEEGNRDLLIGILKNHVLDEIVPSVLLTEETTAQAVGGLDLSFNINHENIIRVNDARIVLPNILANNGILHGIDRVLLEPETDEEPSDSNDPSPPSTDLVIVDEIVAADPMLSTLTAALGTAGLVGALCQDCNFTLFAPINEAFTVIDSTFLTKLLTPPWILHLTEILLLHVTVPSPSRVLSTDLQDGTELTMLNNDTVTINIADGSIFVVTEFSPVTQVVEADLIARNGVVHKIDSVLLPEFVVTDLAGLGNTSAASQFSTLYQLLALTGIALDNCTVFAPTNEAFAALGEETLNTLLAEESRDVLIGILTNHVVAGVVPSVALSDGANAQALGGLNLAFTVAGDGGITVNALQVVAPNILANNGIVHGISGVLLEEDEEAEPTDSNASPSPTSDLIIIDEIVVADPTLSTLTAALDAAGLVGALCQDCNFTLFAPVNEAFAAVDPAFLTKLLTPPWILHLTEILSFHATVPSPNRVLSADLQDGTELTMLNNDTVTIDIVNGSIFVVTEFSPVTEVIEADLIASNGVVHKIDSVLLPPFVVTDLAGLGNTTGASQFSTLYQLLALTGITLDNCTVFAPTNEAFAALGEETLNSLLAEESRDVLIGILTNHVVAGVVPSVALSDGATAQALGGLDLTFTVDDSGITVNGLEIVTPNILANNGIVHGISGVLLEREPEQSTNSTANLSPSTELVIIDEIVATDPTLSTLTAALEAAGLIGAICDDCNVTLFAPVNEAFAVVDPAFLTKLLTPAWILHLINILTFHLTVSTPSRVLSTDLQDGANLLMTNEENVAIDIVDGSIFVVSPVSPVTEVIQADIVALNGVVHKVDSVLLPAFVGIDLLGLGNTTAASEFSTLYQLLALTGIALDNCTVFAPTNEAFAALGEETLNSLLAEESRDQLVGILTNHVVAGVVPSIVLSDGDVAVALGGLDLAFTVAGEGGTIITVNNGIQVVAPNILANNGIVHGINGVLLAAEDGDAPAPPSEVEEEPPSDANINAPLVIIDDIVVADPTLSTLTAALDAAGLVGALCQDCNFTLFAPVNEAFAAVDSDFLAKLLTPPWILHLTEILSFHATAPSTNRVLSTDLQDETVLTMLNNDTVSIDITDDGSIVVVTDFSPVTQVIQADIVASNGVVHKIDSVLLPEFVVTDLAGLGNTSAAAPFSTLYQLLALTGIELDNCTVFAPTNEAFAALGEETLNTLLAEESRDLLIGILTNHVVEGVVPSVALSDGATAQAIGGLDLTFTVDDGSGITVNEAQVVVANILANNGIVHGINAVLLVDEQSAGEETSASASAQAVSSVQRSEDGNEAASGGSSSTTTSASLVYAAIAIVSAWFLG